IILEIASQGLLVRTASRSLPAPFVLPAGRLAGWNTSRMRGYVQPPGRNLFSRRAPIRVNAPAWGCDDLDLLSNHCGRWFRRHRIAANCIVPLLVSARRLDNPSSVPVVCWLDRPHSANARTALRSGPSLNMG